jgi:transposase
LPTCHRNKTDAADAAALLEASRCQTVRPVPIKTVEQQHLLQLHRLREHYKTTRDARLNLLRGALRRALLGQNSSLMDKLFAGVDMAVLFACATDDTAAAAAPSANSARRLSGIPGLVMMSS